MQSFRRAREGSAAAQQRDAMPAAGPRPKRSASMPFHGAGAAKGRDPCPAPAPGGRARLRDEQLRQLRELLLCFDLDRDEKDEGPRTPQQRSSSGRGRQHH